MIKIGVVGTSGGWSSEKLVDTVAEITGFRLLIDMEKVCFDLSRGEAWYDDIQLNLLDALIIKKIGAWYSPDLLDRLEGLRLLNELGMRMYSKPIHILRVLDRLSCTVTLRSAGIPMPPTTFTEDVESAFKAISQYDQAVLKPLYSTKAKGMTVISKNDTDARRKIDAFKEEQRSMYIQKRIDHQGQDLGIVFLGGEYLTTYARSSNGDSWNTTTRSGGKYVPFDPDNSIIEVAKKAQDLFNLDFTCVDVAITDSGPMVFEVSAFGGFRGIQTARGIDAARLYTEYVLKDLRK